MFVLFCSDNAASLNLSCFSPASPIDHTGAASLPYIPEEEGESEFEDDYEEDSYEEGEIEVEGSSYYSEEEDDEEGKEKD